MHLDDRFNNAIIDGLAGEWTKAAPQLYDLWNECFSDAPAGKKTGEDLQQKRREVTSFLARSALAAGEADLAWEAAKRFHDRSPKDHPDRARAVALMAAALIKNGKHEDARVCLAHAGKRLQGTSLNVEWGLFYFYGAELLSDLGKVEMAMESFRQADGAARKSDAVEAIELSVASQLRLAALHQRSGDAAAASDRAAQACQCASKEGKDQRKKKGPLAGLRIFSAAKNEFLLDETFLPCLDHFSEVALEMAAAFSQLGRWTYSERVYEELSAALRLMKVEDHPVRSFALIGKGEMAIKKRRYAEAIRCAEEAARLAGDKWPDPTLYGRFCQNLAQAMSLPKPREDQARFLALLQEAEARDGDGKAAGLGVRIRQQIAFSQFQGGELEKASRSLDECLNLEQTLADPFLLGETHRLIGAVESARGRFRNAERSLKKALEIFQANGFWYEIGAVYLSLGQNFLALGDPGKAGFFLSKGMDVMSELNVEAEMAKFHNAQGRAHLMEEDFESAERCFLKEMKLVKNRDNPLELAYASFYLGRLFRLMGRVYLAEQQLERALDLFVRLNRRDMEAEALMEMALARSAQKGFKPAVEFAMKALAIAEAGSLDLPKIRAYRTMAVIQRDAKKFDAAKRNFEKCELLGEKIGDANIDLAEACFEYSLFFEALRDREEAAERLNRAIEISEKLGLNVRVSQYIARLKKVSPEAAGRLHFRRIGGKGAVVHLDRGKLGDGLVARRDVSILFCDIRGFTSAAETLPLEDVASLLNDFYQITSTAILKCNGRVNKFIGDAALAVFNIDGALERHALWAARAAMELTASVDAVNMVRREKGQLELKIGAGLHCGEAIVGSFGSSLGEDYTVIGDVVNVASRIQNMAGEGDVLISGALHERTVREFEAADMGEHSLKGKGEPVHLWKLVSAREAASKTEEAGGF